MDTEVRLQILERAITLQLRGQAPHILASDHGPELPKMWRVAIEDNIYS